MKANLRLYSAALLAMALLSSCMYIGDSIKPSKNMITRNYDVKEFTKIEANAVGDIYYTQATDGKTSVQISGPDNYIDLFQVSVKDGTLLITMPKNTRFSNGKKLKIEINTPKLNGIDFKGVGDIYIKEGLTTDKLDVSSKGVGDVKIYSLTCEDVKVQSMGVGDVSLQGTAKNAILHSKGVGDIEAQDLHAENVDASSKGVGSITCYATKSIEASAKGVGSIKYGGNPESKQISSKGVGSIKSI